LRIFIMSLMAMAVSTAAFAAPPAEVIAPQAVQEPAQAPALLLKRKIAIGRFSNSTRYGKALLLDPEHDPLADQAADILTARLVDSGKFIVFERSDIDVIGREQRALKLDADNLTGVDTLVIGSVTEFGRKVEGKSGFLNSKMRQVATAKVEVRLVDVATGQAFFSTSGAGSASVEAGEVMGFGSAAGYDSTLNDKAIAAAISDLMTNVLQKLDERRWFTDVLQIRGQDIFISGGPSQGLKVGDRFALETRGERIVSAQSGLPIVLPGKPVGTIQIVSFFGDTASAEGAVARLVDGQVAPADAANLIVIEAR
jgi:curli biogenesis system outer membrane secretion channel CsgG